MTRLPRLVWRESPNQSPRRLSGSQSPWLIVIHRPVGSYEAAVEWLRNPTAQASAHVVTDGNREATQLVAWDRKAWHAASFNSVSYGIEVDDHAWDGSDPSAFATAARIVAFLCHATRIPAQWSRDPLTTAGLVRHRDLGAAGGGHTDPTSDLGLWHLFVATVAAEVRRGGFRQSWGKGTLARARTR